MKKTVQLIRKKGNLQKYREAKEAGLAVVGHRPVEIFVEVSNRCNINCVMCARPEEMGLDTGEISLESIEQISQVFPWALMLHAYGFGEPLMNPHFFRLLELAKRSSLFVDFFTNGMALQEERCRRVVELEVDRIVFSVDGGTPETYEAIRRGARFDRVLNALSAVHEEKQRRASVRPRMSINFVATATNLHELPLLIGLAGERGVSDISVKPLVTYAHKPELEAFRRVYIPQTDDTILDQARTEAAHKGVVLDLSLYLATGAPARVEVSEGGQPPGAPAPRPRCFQPWKTAYVTWKGDIKTCCFAVSPILGNLAQDHLLEIWNGQGYKDLRRGIAKGIYPPDCDHCGQFNLMPTHDDAEDVFRLMAHHMGPVRKALAFSPPSR